MRSVATIYYSTSPTLLVHFYRTLTIFKNFWRSIFFYSTSESPTQTHKSILWMLFRCLSLTFHGVPINKKMLDGKWQLIALYSHIAHRCLCVLLFSCFPKIERMKNWKVNHKNCNRWILSGLLRMVYRVNINISSRIHESFFSPCKSSATMHLILWAAISGLCVRLTVIRFGRTNGYPNSNHINWRHVSFKVKHWLFHNSKECPIPQKDSK